MELKRKVALAAATLSVAFGAGHLMQNGLGGSTQATAIQAERPSAITPLAAGRGIESGPSLAIIPGTAAPAIPETAFAPVTPPAEVAKLPAPVAPPVATEPMPPEMALSGDSTSCPVTLDVIAGAQAMLDLTLIAPCRASERVVIRHGGLALTGMMSLTGSLFASLPGMEVLGEVSVLFGDGAEVKVAEALPDLPLYRRFAVQWMADDAFQLNAFEGGAEFGAPGHISAMNPSRRLLNVPMQGGYLSLLGDARAALPMLAEVYTFPLDLTETVDLTIEASVTATTCDRELLGEVLLSEAGRTTKTDLTMAMPTCDAIGDVLVLNNPLPDLKLATAN